MTAEFIWEALLLGRVQKRQLFMVVYSESLPHLCVTQVKLSFSAKGNWPTHILG